MLDVHRIAAALREIALLLPLKGENEFKARAYERGADAVEALPVEGGDLGPLVDEGRLTAFDGIGEALAARIAELYLTGRSAYLEELRASLPPGVVELSRVPGLSAKRIEALHAALGISSVAELEAACAAGRVAGVKGFGARTQAKIAEGLLRYRERRDGVLLVDALPSAERLVEKIAALPEVARVSEAGALRRREESLAQIDLVVAARAGHSITAVLDAVAAHVSLLTVEERRPGGMTARLGSGLPVELTVVSEDRFAPVLLAATGTPAHLSKLEELARAKGTTLATILDEEAATEGAVFARLGLPDLPPELREESADLDAARAGSSFGDLVEARQIRGLLHCHTTHSDGQNSIEEMARAADALGAEYLTITDHSPAAHYAHGVTLDRLSRQWDEIARVQERVRVRLLRGTEADILEDGALDWPDAVLEQFDVIIASVHSRFGLDPDRATKRLVAAMRSPYFKIWGHALGRLVLRRAPIAVRVEEVLDVIAESRAAIEVNGDPHRLDLEPRWIRAARARGIRFVISTDAHSVANLDYLKYGAWTARRGGLRTGEVLNTLPVDAFLRAVRPVDAGAR